MVIAERPSRDGDDPRRAGLRREALAEIRRILAEELEVRGPVAPEDALAGDLRVDSVGALVLAVALEDHFRVALDDEDASQVVTVADLAELVVRRVLEKPSSEKPGSPSAGESR